MSSWWDQYQKKRLKEERLEEKLYMWKGARMNTILKLRDIDNYMVGLGHQTSVVQVVGAGAGVLASGLTMVGGIMTVLKADTSLPFLVAGAGMGLVSGITGGAAIIRNKVLTSKQMMALVNTVIEVDTAATNDLAREISIYSDVSFKNVMVERAAGMAFTVGGLASSAKGLLVIVRGVDPGQTFISSLSTMGTLVGENLNQDVGRTIVQASGSVLAGTVTTMFGGLSMMWDMYCLRIGIRKLATGGEERSKQIRNINLQLGRQADELLYHYYHSTPMSPFFP